MNIFYAPHLNSNVFELDEQESRHCIKVLRMQCGDKVSVVDGKGGFYEAEILNPHEKHCKLKVLSHISEFESRNFYLHIAIAPTKNIDRFKWFLEKSTEIGIDEITPLKTFHSERRILKIQKLNLTITSAMKQSVKAYHPILNELTDFAAIIRQANDYDAKYIAHCEDGDKMELNPQTNKSKKIIILIGPEGDFSTTEIQEAVDFGFSEISFGKSRLRTETAGVVACHSINFINR